VVTVVTTYEIPSANLPAFEVRFKKLSIAAKRCGVAIAYAVERTFLRSVVLTGNDGVRHHEKRLYHAVRVSGPAPCFDGWRLLGRLDYKTAAPATLRMMVPGAVCPPDFYTVDRGRCDHCKLDRRRNDAFLVQHDNGRTIVVGRTCLRDFLGHESPADIAAQATVLARLGGLGFDAQVEGFGPGGPAAWDPVLVLTLASYAVRTWGWSGSKEEGSTRDAVAGLLLPACDSGIEASRQAMLCDAIESDRERGESAVEWVLGNTETSDYMHNLRSVCAIAVTRRALGVAVSGIVAYNRALERKAAAEAPLVAEGFAGKVGDRITTEADVVLVRFTDGGAWGTTTIIKLRDAAGRILTWFASGSKNVRPGERYAVKGTVKKLDEYRGEKSTVLTRCKLVTIS